MTLAMMPKPAPLDKRNADRLARVAVDVNTLPTFPISAPRAQSQPVWSQNCAICAAMRP